jgi:hypothetical protein
MEDKLNNTEETGKTPGISLPDMTIEEIMHHTEVLQEKLSLKEKQVDDLEHFLYKATKDFDELQKNFNNLNGDYNLATQSLGFITDNALRFITMSIPILQYDFILDLLKQQMFHPKIDDNMRAGLQENIKNIEILKALKDGRVQILPTSNIVN